MGPYSEKTTSPEAKLEQVQTNKIQLATSSRRLSALSGFYDGTRSDKTGHVVVLERTALSHCS